MKDGHWRRTERREDPDGPTPTTYGTGMSRIITMIAVPSRQSFGLNSSLPLRPRHLLHALVPTVLVVVAAVAFLFAPLLSVYDTQSVDSYNDFCW